MNFSFGLPLPEDGRQCHNGAEYEDGQHIMTCSPAEATENVETQVNTGDADQDQVEKHARRKVQYFKQGKARRFSGFVVILPNLKGSNRLRAARKRTIRLAEAGLVGEERLSALLHLFFVVDVVEFETEEDEEGEEHSESVDADVPEQRVEEDGGVGSGVIELLQVGQVDHRHVTDIYL